MASDRDAPLFRAAHLSIAAVSLVDNRMAETGFCPVAGRPGFLRLAGFDNAIGFSIRFRGP
jgi:hypothetical protein